MKISLGPRTKMTIAMRAQIDIPVNFSVPSGSINSPMTNIMKRKISPNENGFLIFTSYGLVSKKAITLYITVSSLSTQIASFSFSLNLLFDNRRVFLYGFNRWLFSDFYFWGLDWLVGTFLSANSLFLEKFCLSFY